MPHTLISDLLLLQRRLSYVCPTERPLSSQVFSVPAPPLPQSGSSLSWELVWRLHHLKVRCSLSIERNVLSVTILVLIIADDKPLGRMCLICIYPQSS